MKKLMFAAAVMAVGAAIAVESGIVGYTTQTVSSNKFAMVGVQFEGCGTAGEIALGDFISGDIAFTDWDENDEFIDTANEIQVWTGGNYEYYFYLNAHEVDDTPQAAGWCDDWGENVAEDVTFTPGQAVWFHARTGACKVTTPGQIVTEDDTDILCKSNKFTMVANFMPVELDLNNADQVAYTDLKGTDWDENDEFIETANEIQVWSGGNYSYYFYLNAHEIDEVDFEEGWCDDWGETASDTIPVGRGFWAHARVDKFTITFKKN